MTPLCQSYLPEATTDIPYNIGNLSIHVVLHVDASMFLCLTEVLKTLVEEHSYLLPLKKKKLCFGLVSAACAKFMSDV